MFEEPDLIIRMPHSKVVLNVNTVTAALEDHLGQAKIGLYNRLDSLSEKNNLLHNIILGSTIVVVFIAVGLVIGGLFRRNPL